MFGVVNDIFVECLRCFLKYNDTHFFEPLTPNLYDMNLIDILFTWITLFHMRITVNFIINGCLCNITDITFNRISS